MKPMKIVAGAPFDAAPFGTRVDEAELRWEDPRELHRVVARFADAPPHDLRLEYWRRHWPQRHLPKDHVPRGGEIGWWELGSWFTGDWQVADAASTIDGDSVTFTFRPIHEREFPDLTNFPATWRTALRIRLRSEMPLPALDSLEAYTDSVWEETTVTVLFERAPSRPPTFEAHNGHIRETRAMTPDRWVVHVWRARNPDPNSWDDTLLTLHADATTTILLNDLDEGPLYVPDNGICAVQGVEEQDYSALSAEMRIRADSTVYAAVSALPEQTWRRAWARMPPKERPIILPLGTDGGRHRFRWDPDGSFTFRTNNSYLLGCRGRDSAALESDRAPLRVSFGLPDRPSERTIQDGVLPIGIAAWEQDGFHIEQVAFVTPLDGSNAAYPSDADVCGVLNVRLSVRKTEESNDARIRIPIRFSFEGESEPLRYSENGVLSADGRVRALIEGEAQLGLTESGGTVYVVAEPAGRAACTFDLKVPYVALKEEDVASLRALDFDRVRRSTAEGWRRRLDQRMTLTTPEPMLNEFFRAHAAHLLVNCEREPGTGRRFARVGSFHYGAFGNESCMMIVDLDRRGYHEEARACLEGFLAYQGSVPLPGDFTSHEGVLYGAHGYECGGYNQHHGWILWCLVEHYRFTRDGKWLQDIAPNLVAASEWIIRERASTRDAAKRGPEWARFGAGLLPHGSLEDIGDWWQWLSTNAYTWRGLDAAAWALEALDHPSAGAVRREADDYRSSILTAFRAAARRSPVVRLRDGTAVPHFPAHVHRRGRSFGWICETLEGALHLLITRLIDPDSREARWILEDYEDNLYLSDHYGYATDDFGRNWFDRGGFSLQACLLYSVEPYLYRDDVKHALRALFNAMAAYYFPDTRMLTEHALVLGEWRGDHFKSSDEANATGWLRYLFIREEEDVLLLGQAIPRSWLEDGARIGVERAATHFGPASLRYDASHDAIVAQFEGASRNPPSRILLRFRPPEGRDVYDVEVNGRRWTDWNRDWIVLPGDIGSATVQARLRESQQDDAFGRSARPCP